MKLSLDRYIQSLSSASPILLEGNVTRVVGPVIEGEV